MRFRIVVIATYEYDVDPNNYAGCNTAEEMLAIDVANVHEQPDMFLDDSVVEVVGKITEL